MELIVVVGEVVADGVDWAGVVAGGEVVGDVNDEGSLTVDETVYETVKLHTESSIASAFIMVQL